MAEETISAKPEAAYDTPMQSVHTEDSPSVAAQAVADNKTSSTSGAGGTTSVESQPTPQLHPDTTAANENPLMGNTNPNPDGGSASSFNDQSRSTASGNANAAPPNENADEPHPTEPGAVQLSEHSQFVVFNRAGGGRLAVKGYDVLEVSEDPTGVVTVMVSGRDPVMGADRLNATPPAPIRVVVSDSFDDVMKAFVGRYY